MGAQQVKDRSGGNISGVTGANNTLGAGTSIRASRIKPRGTGGGGGGGGGVGAAGAGPKDPRNIGSNIFTEHSGKIISLIYLWQRIFGMVRVYTSTTYLSLGDIMETIS